MPHVNFKPLTIRRLTGGADLVRRDESRSVSVGDPALDVMTDFQQVNCVTISPRASLVEANETMIARRVRLLLVMDESGHFLGLITSRDTLGERPMQWINHRGGSFKEITVADLMRTVDVIDVVDISEVAHSRVGDIVATLKSLGRQHLLVAEKSPETGRLSLRGLFSVTQIARQLGVFMQTFEVASTFSEIEAVLAN